MMYYAQLDEHGFCHTVSTVITDIPCDMENLGQTYLEGEWIDTLTPAPTASELRHIAYDTMTDKTDGSPLLLFHNRKYTVNKAVAEYRAYYEGLAPDAEGFKTQINLARDYIRGLYPEEGELDVKI